MLFTVTDFLDTDYVALLDGVRRARRARAHRRAARPRARRARRRGPSFVARRERGHAPRRSRRGSPALDRDDISDILFTSGTTGAPKGAMLTHGASIRAYWSWADVVGLREGDRYLVVNPFFHAFGLKAGILACCSRGATIVPHPVFDVPAVMRRVHEEHDHDAARAAGVYQTILNHPDLDQFDLSSLRLAVTGAATHPGRADRAACARSSAFETVVTGYGLTEAHGHRHHVPPRRRPRDHRQHRRAGRSPASRCASSTTTATQWPPGEPGEVVVRGYNVMQGYFDDPEATAEAIDADGWLHTGDIGVIDERGNLASPTARRTCSSSAGSTPTRPRSRTCMLEHPAVAQVAVVGVPDERLGEVGVAFVVPRTGDAVDPDELIAWCREHMANYKVPRTVQHRRRAAAQRERQGAQVRAARSGRAADARAPRTVSTTSSCTTSGAATRRARPCC